MTLFPLPAIVAPIYKGKFEKKVFLICRYLMPQKPEVIYSYVVNRAKTDLSLKQDKLVYQLIRERFNNIEIDRDKFRKACLSSLKEMKKRAAIKGLGLEDAEDVVQLVLAKALEKYELKGFVAKEGRKYEDRVQAWLCRMTDNESITHHRRMKTRHTDDLEAAESHVVHQKDESLSEEVNAALRRLTESERYIIISIHYEKRKMTDIALELGIGSKEMRQRRLDAEARLRELTIELYKVL